MPGDKSDGKIDDLIKTIAVRHGVAVGRDDPILILHTLNESLIQRNEQAQQELLARFKEDLELISQRWGEETKAKAERMLNAALSASKETMAQMVQEGTASLIAAVRAQIDMALVPQRQARRLAKLNLLASGMTLLAAILVVWVSFR